MSERIPGADGGEGEKATPGLSSLSSAFIELYNDSVSEVSAQQARLRNIAAHHPEIVDTDGFKREAAGIEAQRKLTAAIGAILLGGNHHAIEDDISSLADQTHDENPEQASDTDDNELQ